MKRMTLDKYSFGIGDRFAQQGEAQLNAIIKARDTGIDLVPVWNKSNREHQTIHSNPADTRVEADSAVATLKWDHAYFVDADHINLSTVDRFVPHSDFFTLDVADFIGSPVSEKEVKEFLDMASGFEGALYIDGIEKPFRIDRAFLVDVAEQFLGAIREASAIYQRIAELKGHHNFVAEVSMDEVEHPQTPAELFFILLMIHHYHIPAQTIAPKFTGRFNKGVDYAGDVEQFKKEFEEDLLVIDQAIRTFGVRDNLKLSVHSGSDKFSIYPVMGALIKKYNKGIHVKTAGTTWLEEVIGLAMSGGEALKMAQEIYGRAHARQEELCGPYSTVIDIDPSTLPSPEEVGTWNGDKFAHTLRHDPSHPEYHPGFRQLIHVGYKVAAEMGAAYLEMVRKNSEVVAEQVTTNIFERHIKRLFNS
jgi:hypothetical protein